MCGAGKGRAEIEWSYGSGADGGQPLQRVVRSHGITLDDLDGSLAEGGVYGYGRGKGTEVANEKGRLGIPPVRVLEVDEGWWSEPSAPRPQMNGQFLDAKAADLVGVNEIVLPEP